MDRKEYNKCMVPFISGSKPKEQRKLDFCVGAKICSGKAQNREQAAQLCGDIGSKSAQRNQTPQNNRCASIIDMATWVQQPNDDGVCRPCLLAPLTAWYMDVLKTEGMNDLAKDLESVVGTDEIAVAAKLDEVKGNVSTNLRDRLKEFDCHAQLYQGE